MLSNGSGAKSKTDHEKAAAWLQRVIQSGIEAATIGVLWKNVFLEISQNSQENTCARVSFLKKLQS